MDKLMVTLLDHCSGDVFDLEVPLEVEIEKLLDDIVQSLNGCDQKQRPPACELELYSRRQNRVLGRDKNLDQEQVWTGDYLELNYHEYK